MDDERDRSHQPADYALEQPVTLIPIDLDLTQSQTSGLAWYGDYLILLPQYPDWAQSGSDGVLLALHKREILDILEYKRSGALHPQPVPFLTGGLARQIPKFEGYEAIAIHGDQIFVTIEASPDKMLGHLIGGSIAPDLSEIRLDPGQHVEIPPLADNPNSSYETLLIADDQILAIYENNGALNVAHPVAYVFDLALQPRGTLPFPNIEYRITDADTLDAQGRFWAMNFYWPGTGGVHEYPVGPDALAAKYGKGHTHAQEAVVERIVQLQYSPTGITLIDRPPVQLVLLDALHSRNWEGLVTLDDRGFLIITDTYPVAMLGFVPFPPAD